MNRRIPGPLAVAAAFFGFSLLIFSQSAFAFPQSDAATVGPDGASKTEIQGITIPQVPGIPFSGKQQVVVTNTLANGTVVSRKYFTIVARDSQGRVHRESRGSVPADSDLVPPLLHTILLDPAAHTRTECYPAGKYCEVKGYKPLVSVAQTASPNSTPEFQRESIGDNVLESMNVTGTRESRTYPSGVAGNTEPIAVTKEIWFSPQLQVNLSVVRNDPRTGIESLKITELKLDEPAASLFDIPDGYKVLDQRKSSTD